MSGLELGLLITAGGTFVVGISFSLMQRNSDGIVIGLIVTVIILFVFCFVWFFQEDRRTNAEAKRQIESRYGVHVLKVHADDEVTYKVKDGRECVAGTHERDNKHYIVRETIKCSAPAPNDL